MDLRSVLVWGLVTLCSTQMIETKALKEPRSASYFPLPIQDGLYKVKFTDLPPNAQTQFDYGALGDKMYITSETDFIHKDYSEKSLYASSDEFVNSETSDFIASLHGKGEDFPPRSTTHAGSEHGIRHVSGMDTTQIIKEGQKSSKTIYTEIQTTYAEREQKYDYIKNILDNEKYESYFNFLYSSYITKIEEDIDPTAVISEDFTSLHLATNYKEKSQEQNSAKYSNSIGYEESPKYRQMYMYNTSAEKSRGMDTGGCLIFDGYNQGYNHEEEGSTMVSHASYGTGNHQLHNSFHIPDIQNDYAEKRENSNQQNTNTNRVEGYTFSSLMTNNQKEQQPSSSLNQYSSDVSYGSAYRNQRSITTGEDYDSQCSNLLIQGEYHQIEQHNKYANIQREHTEKNLNSDTSLYTPDCESDVPDDHHYRVLPHILDYNEQNQIVANKSGDNNYEIDAEVESARNLQSNPSENGSKECIESDSGRRSSLHQDSDFQTQILNIPEFSNNEIVMVDDSNVNECNTVLFNREEKSNGNVDVSNKNDVKYHKELESNKCLHEIEIVEQHPTPQVENKGEYLDEPSELTTDKNLVVGALNIEDLYKIQEKYIHITGEPGGKHEMTMQIVPGNVASSYDQGTLLEQEFAVKQNHYSQNDRILGNEKLIDSIDTDDHSVLLIDESTDEILNSENQFKSETHSIASTQSESNYGMVQKDSIFQAEVTNTEGNRSTVEARGNEWGDTVKGPEVQGPQEIIQKSDETELLSLSRATDHPVIGIRDDGSQTLIGVRNDGIHEDCDIVTVHEKHDIDQPVNVHEVTGSEKQIVFMIPPEGDGTNNIENMVEHIRDASDSHMYKPVSAENASLCVLTERNNEAEVIKDFKNKAFSETGTISTNLTEISHYHSLQGNIPQSVSYLGNSYVVSPNGFEMDRNVITQENNTIDVGKASEDLLLDPLGGFEICNVVTKASETLLNTIQETDNYVPQADGIDVRTPITRMSEVAVTSEFDQGERTITGQESTMLETATDNNNDILVQSNRDDDHEVVISGDSSVGEPQNIVFHSTEADVIYSFYTNNASFNSSKTAKSTSMDGRDETILVSRDGSDESNALAKNDEVVLLALMEEDPTNCEIETTGESQKTDLTTKPKDYAIDQTIPIQKAITYSSKITEETLASIPYSEVNDSTSGNIETLPVNKIFNNIVEDEVTFNNKGEDTLLEPLNDGSDVRDIISSTQEHVATDVSVITQEEKIPHDFKCSTENVIVASSDESKTYKAFLGENKATDVASAVLQNEIKETKDNGLMISENTAVSGGRNIEVNEMKQAEDIFSIESYKEYQLPLDSGNVKDINEITFLMANKDEDHKPVTPDQKVTFSSADRMDDAFTTTNTDPLEKTEVLYDHICKNQGDLLITPFDNSAYDTMALGVQSNIDNMKGTVSREIESAAHTTTILSSGDTIKKEFDVSIFNSNGGIPTRNDCVTDSAGIVIDKNKGTLGDTNEEGMVNNKDENIYDSFTTYENNDKDKFVITNDQPNDTNKIIQIGNNNAGCTIMLNVDDEKENAILEEQDNRYVDFKNVDDKNEVQKGTNEIVLIQGEAEERVTEENLETSMEKSEYNLNSYKDEVWNEILSHSDTSGHRIDHGGEGKEFSNNENNLKEPMDVQTNINHENVPEKLEERQTNKNAYERNYIFDNEMKEVQKFPLVNPWENHELNPTISEPDPDGITYLQTFQDNFHFSGSGCKKHAETHKVNTDGKETKENWITSINEINNNILTNTGERDISQTTEVMMSGDMFQIKDDKYRNVCEARKEEICMSKNQVCAGDINFHLSNERNNFCKDYEMSDCNSYSEIPNTDNRGPSKVLHSYDFDKSYIIDNYVSDPALRNFKFQRSHISPDLRDYGINSETSMHPSITQNVHKSQMCDGSVSGPHLTMENTFVKNKKNEDVYSTDYDDHHLTSDDGDLYDNGHANYYRYPNYQTEKSDQKTFAAPKLSVMHREDSLLSKSVTNGESYFHEINLKQVVTCSNEDDKYLNYRVRTEGTKQWLPRGGMKYPELGDETNVAMRKLKDNLEYQSFENNLHCGNGDLNYEEGYLSLPDKIKYSSRYQPSLSCVNFFANMYKSDLQLCNNDAYPDKYPIQQTDEEHFISGVKGCPRRKDQGMHYVGTNPFSAVFLGKQSDENMHHKRMALLPQDSNSYERNEPMSPTATSRDIRHPMTHGGYAQHPTWFLSFQESNQEY